FLAISPELAEHHVGFLQRRNHAKDLHLLVAERFVVHASRRLHCQEGHHLEQMVLHDVADRAGLLVELYPSLNAETFGHRDLHALHIIAVPDRLKKSIGETKEEQVLDAFFAEIMVDAENILFRKHGMRGGIQGAGGSQVSTERLLKDDPGVARTSGLSEPLDHPAEQAGRDR